MAGGARGLGDMQENDSFENENMGSISYRSKLCQF